MLRHWMLGGISSLMIVSVIWARPGVVKTRDGQTYDGDIDEQPDEVVVDHKGIHTTITRDRIQTVSYFDSIEQQYRRRLAKLTQYDVAGRLELAHWLFANKAYDLARQVLEDAQSIRPHNEEVAAMLQTLERQVQLERSEARKKAPVELAAADNNPRGGAPPPDRGQQPQQKQPERVDIGGLLMPEEVNLVKQSEWQEGQVVKVKFENDVRRRYVAREGLDPAVFNRQPPAQQAWAIVRHGSPDMKKDVIILNDPPVMLQYKKVQATIVNVCAKCHTQDKPAGGFGVHFPDESEAATYTNFVLLQRYSEMINKNKFLMINRERPQDSLLAQFALPPDVGDPGHQKVPNYNGVARTRNDQRYRQLADWLSALNPVAPEYDFDLTSGGPGEKAAPKSNNPPPARGGAAGADRNPTRAAGGQ